MSSHISSIKRSSLVNMAGAVVPLLVTLVTLPLFLPLVGEFRYGALMLLWAVLGYMGVLDMGLGRAVSQHIAQTDKPEHIADVLWSGIWLSVLMGVVGGLIVTWLAPWLSSTVFSTPPDLHAELKAALAWMVLALPLSTLSSVLLGALQGRHAFVAMNIAQVTGSVLALIFPLLLAMNGVLDLGSLFVAMLAARGLQLFMLYRACRRAVSDLPPRLGMGQIPSLLRFGGWVSISSVLNPILELTDRFVIGHRMDLAAVTAYTVPYSMATRLSLVPGSLSSVLFPRFSSVSGFEAQALMLRARLVLAAIMTPLVVLGILLAPFFLQLWLGANLGARMGPVAVILLIGIWINALAFLPYSYLQAQGRPDLPAKLHLIEVLPYLVFLWWAVDVWGIQGAALAWTLRVSVDGVLLFIAAYRQGKHHTSAAWLDLPSLFAAALLVLGAALLMLVAPAEPAWKLDLGALVLILCSLWLRKNTPQELRDFACILWRKLRVSAT
jgi:O-antigen/teichoic acid export membrane protein